jgi:hypothetical protein
MGSDNLVLRPAPLAGRLWKLLFAIAVVFVTVAIANCFLPADRAISRGMFGHDFLAFYSAGKLVRDGRAAELYDLDAMTAVQQQIASSADLELSSTLAPYWNPPHVALLVSPLAEFSFGSALLLWTAFGVLCLVFTALMLAALVRESTTLKSHWLLVPAAMLLAPPTLQAFGHGQNTPLSLLLLTLTVLSWRAREPIWAGLCCSLLFYKPQLAAVIVVSLSLTLGWRVWVGMLVGGVPQLLLTVTRLPGSLSDYLQQLPRNLELVQFAQPYVWHRHSTLNGFFRFVFQGNAPGQTLLWITALSTTCALLIGVAIAYVWWRKRGEMHNALTSDRFIALVILAMPLLMPFYFDYDLLLLIVPGILIGIERLESRDTSSTSRWLTITGCVLFVWTMFNPPIAEAFGISLTVPLLCIVVALQAKRCLLPIDNQLSLPLSLRTQERLAA